MNKIIAVVPTYNEIDNIGKLIDELFKTVPEMDILIVDDSSPDGTGKYVAERAKTEPRLNLLSRPSKSGLGTAYRDGFSWALKRDYEYIVQMDADFSHNPEDIPRFLEEINGCGCDLVIGSRYVTGVNVVNWPLSRLFLSYGANLYTRIITGMPIKDSTGGFKCFKAEALKKIDLSKVKSNGYGFQIEMNYRMWKSGAKIKELPIIFIDRRSGYSKMNKKIIYEAIFLVWKLKFLPK